MKLFLVHCGLCDAVDGRRVALEPDPALNGSARLTGHRHRDLAPKTAPEPS
jgi:hypothetical protein